MASSVCHPSGPLYFTKNVKLVLIIIIIFTTKNEYRTYVRTYVLIKLRKKCEIKTKSTKNYVGRLLLIFCSNHFRCSKTFLRSQRGFSFRRLFFCTRRPTTPSIDRKKISHRTTRRSWSRFAFHVCMITSYIFNFSPTKSIIIILY